MKRVILPLVLCFLVPALPVCAQAEPVKRAAEHDRLNFLVGEFDTVDKTFPSQWSPGGESRNHAVIKWGVGGAWLLMDVDGGVLEMEFHGHGLITYNPIEKQYVELWFDNYTSDGARFTGGFDEQGALVLGRKVEAQGMQSWERQRWTDLGDGRLGLTIEMSMDGQAYQPWMESVYTPAPGETQFEATSGTFAKGEQPMANRFCHIELNSNEPDKSQEFYSKLFENWKMQSTPMGDQEYVMIDPGADPQGGIMKNPVPGAPSHWFIYIEVGNIGAYTDKAKELGATIHIDSRPVPDMGFFSIIEDPTGAVFGIWEPPKK